MGMDVKGRVRRIVEEGLNPMLWGRPGVGKTSFVEELAKDMNCHLETVVGSTKQPHHVEGLPFLPKNKEDRGTGVNYESPVWVARLNNTDKRPMLFLDEIPNCAPSVQSSLLELVRIGEVNEVSIPDETIVIAAGNPPEMLSAGHPLEPPLANRFEHIEFEPSVEYVVEGFTSGFPQENYDEISSERKLGRSRVAAYLKRRGQEFLINVPDEVTKAGRAWPSPRTWENVAYLISKDVDNNEIPNPELVKSAVGSQAANDFVEYLTKSDLPDPKEVINRGADKFDTDKWRDDQLFSILSSLSSAVGNSEKLWKDAMKIGIKVKREGKGDVVVNACRSLMEIRPSGIDLGKTDVPELYEVYESAGEM